MFQSSNQPSLLLSRPVQRFQTISECGHLTNHHSTLSSSSPLPVLTNIIISFLEPSGWWVMQYAAHLLTIHFSSLLPDGLVISDHHSNLSLVSLLSFSSNISCLILLSYFLQPGSVVQNFSIGYSFSFS